MMPPPTTTTRARLGSSGGATRASIPSLKTIVARRTWRDNGRMRRAVLVWVGSVALGVDCSLLTDLGGLGSPDAATAADGSSSDGPSVGDVQGIDAPQGDASVNLLANPDFEQGTGACGPG